MRRWLAPPSLELDPLGLEADQTVADLGAGVGYFAEEVLARVGPRGRLYLIDPDARNLGRVRRGVAGDSRVSMHVASANRCPWIPDASVDRVLLSLVLCCLVDKRGVMNEVWRIVRPGGLACITYPRRRRWYTRRRAVLRVTPEVWALLERDHPWTPLPIRSSWLVTRHLLARPESEGPAKSPGDGSVGVDPRVGS